MKILLKQGYSIFFYSDSDIDRDSENVLDKIIYQR